jgi:hypothetical protein
MVGMGVREHHRLDVAEPPAQPADTLGEQGPLARQAAINERQAAAFLHQVPVDAATPGPEDARCDLLYLSAHPLFAQRSGRRASSLLHETVLGP